jgi:hypothetical protein
LKYLKNNSKKPPETMKKLYRLLTAVLILTSFFSCSEAKFLQKGLAKHPQPLGYTFVSEVDTMPKMDSVIVSFRGFPLDSLTSVKRTKGLVLPFIFVNYLDFKYQVKLGNNLLDQDFNDFFFDSLLDESERSGQYALCYDSTRQNDVYSLEVFLDTCVTTSLYQETELVIYYVYGYSISWGEGSWPALSRMTCNVRLLKGDKVLLEKPFSVSYNLPCPETGRESRSVKLDIMAGNMVESLCQSTQECISSVVKEVNLQLKAQKR